MSPDRALAMANRLRRRGRDLIIRRSSTPNRFDDYKESMIALLVKVVRVSIDTVAMKSAER
jgi:hypothetical protein